jgi:hypothetical protein
MEEVVVRIPMPSRVIAALAALVVGLASSGSAAAWSEPAQRTIADLAYARLTPQARSAVDQLTAQGGVLEPSCPIASLADASLFLDCVDGVRRFNDLRRLHYEERPLCGAATKEDFCKDGRCATEAIKRAVAVLSDPLAAQADRLLALAQVVHLMGDIHQPFDMIDNRDDRGLDIRVSLPGSSNRRLNLHDVWSDTLPALAVGSGELGPGFLEPLASANETAWSRGDIDAWGDETHALARALYERLPERPECGRRPRNTEVLDRAYILSGTTTVREQLAKAGVRVAAILNDALR